MTLQLVKGRSYKARNGEKFGPITENTFPQEKEWKWTAEGAKTGTSWRENGTYGYGEDPFDLIEEWADTAQESGPVRTETVTRMVIVPGTYGNLVVGVDDDPTGFVRVGLGRELMNASELRAAARVFVSLAEALEQ